MFDLHQLNTHTHLWSTFDASSIVPTKQATDYMVLSQTVSTAGSIWTRSVSHNLNLTQDFSDFYGDTVPDPITFVSEAVGNFEHNRSVTSAMTLTGSYTKTGGQPDYQHPLATFDSNTSAGMAVYVSSANSVDLANADDPTTAICVGLALIAVAAGETGAYQSDGQITIADWTAATGAATLTPGVIYYLDTTNGMMTSTPPTGAGNHIVRIGLATSTTAMSLEIARPILLAI